MGRTCSPTLRTGTTPMRALVTKTSSAARELGERHRPYLGAQARARRIHAARCHASRRRRPRGRRAACTIAPPLTRNTLLIVPPTTCPAAVEQQCIEAVRVLAASRAASTFSSRLRCLMPASAGFAADRQLRHAQLTHPRATRSVGAVANTVITRRGTMRPAGRVAARAPLPRVTMILSTASVGAGGCALRSRRATRRPPRAGCPVAGSPAPAAPGALPGSARDRAAHEHGLEQAIAVLQAAIVDRHRGAGNAIDPAAEHVAHGASRRPAAGRAPWRASLPAHARAPSPRRCRRRRAARHVRHRP